MLADFRVQYPAVRFDVDLSIATRDLVAEGFDLAIRTARTLDPNLVARRLGVVREAIVAGPAYLAAHAPDGRRTWAASKPCALAISTTKAAGCEQRGEESIAVPVKRSLARSRFIGVRRDDSLSLGVVRLHRYLLGEELVRCTLVGLMPDWQTPATPSSLACPGREHMPTRAREFREYVTTWVLGGSHIQQEIRLLSIRSLKLCPARLIPSASELESAFL